MGLASSLLCAPSRTRSRSPSKIGSKAESIGGKTLGMVEGNLLLLVAHVDRDEDDVPVVRIVSARVATPKERRRYARDRQA